MKKSSRKRKRGPHGARSDAYESAEKWRPRFTIWRRAHAYLRRLSLIDRELKPDNCDVAFMPSSEGIEINVASRAGFRVDKMHVIDRNPAIVATLKRRYPSINTYGVEADEAIRRMGKQGTELAFAHFDFTSNLNGLARQLYRISSDEKPFRADHVICVTFLRGREGHWNDIREAGLDLMRVRADEIDRQGKIGNMKAGDLARLGFLAALLTGPSTVRAGKEIDYWRVIYLDHGAYMSSSGHSPMMWAIFLRTPREFEERADFLHFQWARFMNGHESLIGLLRSLK